MTGRSQCWYQLISDPKPVGFEAGERVQVEPIGFGDGNTDVIKLSCCPLVFCHCGKVPKITYFWLLILELLVHCLGPVAAQWIMTEVHARKPSQLPWTRKQADWREEGAS